MDFFAILIVITAIINAINAIRQKGKGSQPAPPIRVARRAAPPHDDESRKQPGMAGEQWPQPLPQTERHGYEADQFPQLQRHKTEHAARTPITTDIVRMLSKKDGLVAAFVLHEILDRPRSLRRR